MPIKLFFVRKAGGGGGGESQQILREYGFKKNFENYGRPLSEYHSTRQCHMSFFLLAGFTYNPLYSGAYTGGGGGGGGFTVADEPPRSSKFRFKINGMRASPFSRSIPAVFHRMPRRLAVHSTFNFLTCHPVVAMVLANQCVS